jgi:hypothetical protein
MSEYIVRTASAKMPASCKGCYRKVAVIEVEDGVVPKMISERARGVLRIVEMWDALNVGKTDRCAYKLALLAANHMAERLNARGESD